MDTTLRPSRWGRVSPVNLLDDSAGREFRNVAGASGAANSLLRNLATKGLECDCVWLRTAATAGVQTVDPAQLVGGKLEVEHVDVLCDSAGLGGLRDDGAPLLQPPAQHSLGGALAMGSRDLPDDRIVECAAVVAVGVERDPADR